MEYIRKADPSAAQRTAQTIYERAGTLATFPNLGRTGRVFGTRELPLPPLPFILVYRVLEHADAVENRQRDTRRPTLAVCGLAAVLFTYEWYPDASHIGDGGHSTITTIFAHNAIQRLARCYDVWSVKPFRIAESAH